MALLPDFDSFARAYDAGENQVVYARLTADLDTPVSLMMKLADAGDECNPAVMILTTGARLRLLCTIRCIKASTDDRGGRHVNGCNNRSKHDSRH